MRCRCCDRDNADYVGGENPDWYCAKCYLIIKKTTGETFGLAELEKIILGSGNTAQELGLAIETLTGGDK